MQVWLNDIETELTETLNIEQALDAWEYKGNSFAVAVNSVFIPKESHAQTLIKNGDRIDIVTPMQGG